MVELYVLRCPTTGEIRYAGKAINAKQRLCTHMRDAHKRKTPVYSWILALKKVGLAPTVEVVALVSQDQWEAEEIKLIAALRAAGCRLLNLADGGNAPSQTLEQRRAACLAMNEKVNADVSAKSLRALKMKMGQLYRWALSSGLMEFAEERRRVMVSFSNMSPRLFGVWASLGQLAPHAEI